MSTIVEWRENSKGSVKSEVEKEKLPSLNIREKIVEWGNRAVEHVRLS